MLLTHLSYSQDHAGPKHWEIQDVALGEINLIVGKNAVGKTRMMNVLKNVARQISGKMTRLLNGETKLIFAKGHDKNYTYHLNIVNQEVEEERFVIDGRTVLERNQTKAEIWDSEGNRKLFEPPADKLTLQVRRDRREYPYLEDLFAWAESYYAFMFSTSMPTDLFIGNFREDIYHLESLAMVPQILQQLLAAPSGYNNIIADMKAIGYSIDKIALAPIIPPVIPLPALAVKLQEQDLTCETSQIEMSSGMYRALAMVVIVEYLLEKKTPCTFAVDDIGEGLDFERSHQLIQWILEKTKESRIQVILTSNDRHLLNGVDVRHWNILERQGSKIVSYNYANSKEMFDEFAMTGLSNFELLSAEMYKEVKAE
jgi:hypothetical protein